MACEKALVILFVSLCSSWCARAEAADSEGRGGYSGSMLQITVAVAYNNISQSRCNRAYNVALASYSGLCVVDVWKTLERWSRETEDGQDMACLPVYGCGMSVWLWDECMVVG